MEEKFAEIDAQSRWSQSYLEIRNDSQDFPYKVAKYPENRARNRYRDVSPFDHSRVKLQKADNDYINASLIVMEEAQRNYILTQGPLPNSCGHFWQMVWEQKSRAVVMLNRIIEKGSVKCEKYWPSKEDEVMSFDDTQFSLKLLSEDVKSYYTVRQLQLQRISTGETREILHFHYTTWPDFGVPESPASFLNFLLKVRESGSLSCDCGPAVVHCSAGIGRSGTFALVDTCLVLMEKRKDPSTVDIREVLLEMRKYRMGLIQTPDQLRFSYMAVIEGAKYIKGDSSAQKRWKELSNEDQDPVTDQAPPPPQPPKRTLPRQNENRDPDVTVEEATEPENNSSSQETFGKEQENTENKVNNLRKRHREDRIASTAQKVHRMKQKLSETEVKRKRPCVLLRKETRHFAFIRKSTRMPRFKGSSSLSF
ncbi:tyrosine-protein phosphatase non-receptor type 2-like isoform X1 [Hemiscyllium ocellatum]|uniref:tyrosine-protein phosphatase non-receptor type 2-like isoform X1 n=1 Tax=Hemiscyllium ocellatum TaxID=170820 RepID=UPI00296720EB|nr:tyrosine-protein phosphatase non-receptor type 2-like isoform X1 [Hemiscyllium ocellatum]